MSVASRTPEGLPSRCPLCGAATNLDFSEPPGDAVCPNCGCLIWLAERNLTRAQELLSRLLNAPAESIDVDSVLRDLGGDSLDTVELVMELEEEFDINIPEEDADRIKTVGDALRYLDALERTKQEDRDEEEE